jgi:peroxiredoxin
MKVVVVVASLFVASLACAAAPPRDPMASGQKAPDFSLPIAGAAGAVALKDELAKNKLTVLMFVATRCPVSNAYNARMAQLAKDYADKGVRFVGVNSNKAETPEEIVAHAREHGFTFPVVKDAGNKVADLYGARVTPEIFVVDPHALVRYHGRIDEKQDGADVKSPDLRAALDALLAGKAAPTTDTKAFGCSIKRL